MKKYLILSLICLLTLCGCGKIPKLSNGDEAVLTFEKGDKKHKISANDLYEELKNNLGLQATIKLIDDYILNTEFKDYVEEAKTNADSYIEAMIESYGDEKTLLEQLQQYTSYSSIDAYKEYLQINYMQAHATEEYAKLQIKDDEIEKYYNEKVFGDVEVYHILITADVKDDMKDDEKKAAEKKAKDTVNEIIDKLKKSKNPEKLEEFKNLAKEYSKDAATKEKGGSLGFINYGDLNNKYDELLDSVYKLKDGEYSKSVITTELGYHVIFRAASKEKEALKDVKDTIVKTLADELMSKDTKISVNATTYWREQYNTKIIDSELDRQYGIYINNLINATNTEDNN